MAIIETPLFDLSSDGIFTRASPATFFDLTTQAYTEWNANERRMFGDRIFIEGERINFADNTSIYVVNQSGGHTISSTTRPDPKGGTTADQVNAASAGLVDRQFTQVGSGSAQLQITFFLNPSFISPIPFDVSFDFIQRDSIAANTTITIDNADWKRYLALALETGGVTTPEGQFQRFAPFPRLWDGWGWQIERGYFPSTFIENDTNGTATRNRELLTFSVPTELNDSTWYIEFEPEFTHSEVDPNDVFYPIFNVTHAVGFTTLYLQPTAPGVCAMVLVREDGTNITVASVQWTLGSTLKAEINTATGELELSGFSLGNGSYGPIGRIEMHPNDTLEFGSRFFSSNYTSFWGYMGSITLVEDQKINVSTYRQKTRNTVEVVYSRLPKHIDPNDANDCVNPDNYTVTVTGAPSGSPERLIQHIDYVGDNTVDIIFDGYLIEGANYSISIANLEAENGAELDPDPTVIAFTAYGQERQSVETIFPRDVSYDIANPQLESMAGQNQSLATLQVDELGDLENDTGRISTKKRILRRITTEPGGYRHIPSYGLLVAKGTALTTLLLQQLKIDTESQIIREPEILEVQATVNEVVPGVVRMSLLARDKLGVFDMAKVLDLRESIR